MFKQPPHGSGLQIHMGLKPGAPLDLPASYGPTWSTSHLHMLTSGLQILSPATWWVPYNIERSCSKVPKAVFWVLKKESTKSPMLNLKFLLSLGKRKEKLELCPFSWLLHAHPLLDFWSSNPFLINIIHIIKCEYLI